MEDKQWYFISQSHQLPEEGRLHCKVNGRYITLFRHKATISAIDSICHHAGGPLTLGKLEDIEDLGVRVVLCPWHNFMVTIDQGLKAYQSIEIQNGTPVNTGWKLGKSVQRAHYVLESPKGLFLVRQTKLQKT